ncbi:hypothetical protein LCGC14_1131080 [marine sediment metagenome]|uniref:Uncharacterized protein n=1 Tax=marine sediment metagenome TaxID=412755 RepID=A0A0F9M104_9ZZZZ
MIGNERREKNIELEKFKVKKIPGGYKKLKDVRNSNSIIRNIKEQKRKGNLLKFKEVYKTHYVGTMKRNMKIYELYIRKKPIKKK